MIAWQRPDWEAQIAEAVAAERQWVLERFDTATQNRLCAVRWAVEHGWFEGDR